MGPDPPYGAGSGQLSAQGCATDQWEADKELGGRGPPLAAAMEEAGFEEIGVYIKKRQNRVAQYNATRSILDLCERSVRSPEA